MLIPSKIMVAASVQVKYQHFDDTVTERTHRDLSLPLDNDEW